MEIITAYKTIQITNTYYNNFIFSHHIFCLLFNYFIIFNIILKLDLINCK